MGRTDPSPGPDLSFGLTPAEALAMGSGWRFPHRRSLSVTIPRRVAVATAMALVTATLSVGVAGAADPATDEPDDGLETLGPDPQMDDLIADTLRALGVAPAAVDEIIAAIGDGASRRLGVMLDDGVVTEDQLAVLSEHVEAGTLPDDIDRVVDETRARRDAFREAAEDLLGALGVELDPDLPVRDALVDNDIAPDEFIARLDEELPPPPGRGDDEPAPPPEPTYPTTPTPAPRPTPTTTAPPPPPTTTTTVPAAPDAGYPTPPSPPPAAEYPTHDPAPAHQYPEAGGGAGEENAPDEESY